MTQGVSGYFDIAGEENFTGRFFYSEEYDKTSGKRIVSITGISIQSTVYGGTWYPGGTVAVEGETLCTMEFEGKVTHQVTVSASDAWKEVAAVDMWGLYFPWTSGEIASNADGSRSITFAVDITLWRSTDNYTVSIQGEYTVKLTDVQMGLVYIKNGESWDAYQIYEKNGESWVLCIPYIKNGESWDMCG